MEGHQDEAKNVILSCYSLAFSSSVNFSTGGFELYDWKEWSSLIIIDVYIPHSSHI